MWCQVYIIDITVSTEHIVIARRYSAFKRLRDEVSPLFLPARRALCASCLVCLTPVVPLFACMSLCVPVCLRAYVRVVCVSVCLCACSLVQLVHMFPRVGVPVLPQSGSFRSLDNTYLSKKQLALHEWLAEVVAIPQLAKSNTLLEFLKDDESEKTLDPCRYAPAVAARWYALGT